MGLRTFTNTRLLSEAANDFIRYGYYTKAPKGTPEYKSYWAEQKRRCKQGYSVGDVSITGRHYFYLNFCPIKKTEKKKDGSWNVMSAKKLLFPSFWEIDYNWWWAKEIAMFGMTKEDVQILGIDGLPIKDYTDAKHLSCLKTRRAGFSYKEAADGVWNYNFVPGSKSYFFASKDDYLTKDGILNKVTTYLDHLNGNTQNFWRRNRMVKDTMMLRRASYLDTRKNEKGYKSEILGVIIDDPDKVRGKDGIKITYEEAGSFKNLKAALAISVPSVRDGATITGQISVFGTGGEEGPDIEGLEDIFLAPEEYDMLAFNNIWEEGMEETVCGYFVPCTHANQDFMDGDGNVDVQGALEYDETERAKKKRLRDPKELDRRIAEFPRTPSEALQRISANIFPVAQAQACLRRLEKNQAMLASVMHGVLYQGDKEVEFRPTDSVRPIHQFPHKNDDDLTGCVSIFFQPQKDYLGRVNPEHYFVSVDPFYKEQAEDRTSLWSASVWKHKFKGDPYGGIKMATFVGRPAQLSTAYRNTVLLSGLFGGCKIQSEIAGGGQGLYDYLKTKKLLHLAAFQPLLFSTKEVNSEKNRSYFMNLSTDDKKNGLSYYAEHLMEQIGINEQGQPIYYIDMIRDPAELREIIKFNPDPKKNFDRISDAIVAMYTMREFQQSPPSSSTEVSSFLLNAVQGGDEKYMGGDYNSLDDLLVPD